MPLNYNLLGANPWQQISGSLQRLQTPYQLQSGAQQLQQRQMELEAAQRQQAMQPQIREAYGQYFAQQDPSLAQLARMSPQDAMKILEMRQNMKQMQKTQFGGQVYMVDQKGNPFFATTKRDPYGNTVDRVITPLSDVQKPVGALVEPIQGMTPEQYQRHVADVKKGELEVIATEEQKEELRKEIPQRLANIQLYDDAITEINRGASTGRISSLFPDFRRSTIALRNIQNQLSLNQLQMVSMGALSDKELEVLQETAIPTYMDEPELKEWLKRRRDAEEKLLNFAYDYSSFLNAGGTLDEWQQQQAKQYKAEQEYKKKAESRQPILDQMTPQEQAINMPSALSPQEQAELDALRKEQGM